MPKHGLEDSARSALRGGSFLLWVSFVLSFVVSVLHLAGPLFIILIYDRVLNSRSTETLVALLMMVSVLIVTLGLLDFARKRLVARFAAQFQERLEHTILSAAQKNAMFPQGTLKPVSGLDEADYLRGFFHSGGLIAVMDFVWAPMFVAVVFILHPTLGYLTLAALAVMTILVCIRLGFLGQRQDRSNAAAQRIGDLKNMVVSSREVVRGQDMGPGFKSKWLTARAQARDNAIALRDWTAWFDQMTNTTLQLARYGVLATGAFLVLDGKLTVGAMVACAFIVTRALIPVNSFVRTVPTIFKAIDSWKKLKKILVSWDKTVPEAFPTRPANSNERLSVQDLCVKSPLTEKLILRQLSLSANRGDIIEIVGATGQGKTALAQAIIGLATRTAGAILIDGANIARLTDEEMGEAVGYVPEVPRFFNGTIAENISRLDPDATSDKISSAARKACLHARIEALSKGYQTVIDPSATILPQGERHQLSLARALYRNPKILVIDELDAILTERIPQTLNKTLTRMTDKGGTVILLSRKPVDLNLKRQRYKLSKGQLGKPVSITPDLPETAAPKKAAQMGKNVTVIGDKNRGRAAGDD